MDLLHVLEFGFARIEWVSVMGLDTITNKASTAIVEMADMVGMVDMANLVISKRPHADLNRDRWIQSPEC